ncbi:MAG: 3-oxoacyl-ACP reductase [Deltaproteobacteria bacterium RIFCSPHIGHO2_12_FULL_43_9]|nr:MAG: 3-oxoacyl-ACP reductase [Deltaproteobacteria bacterium RIFCSPHIGHO2_12_FULL_43_9]
MESQTLKSKWALILGASSGFGAAAAKEFAAAGINIIGVHLDRRSTLPLVEALKQEIEKTGQKALFFNVNASDEIKRKEVLDSIAPALNGEPIHILLHSLAFGTLKPFIHPDPSQQMTKAQIEMTLDVMAHSLVYWTQDLVARNLLRKGSRVYAMTSSGGERVFPTYGAISAAKATLESHCRQLTLELGEHGIRFNAIRAGVTDTPALRKIPNAEKIMEFAKYKNPSKRLTTPEDVAKSLVALSLPGTEWITGNVIGIDGGENIVD